MRSLVIIFLAAFLVFGTIGFIKGRAKVRTATFLQYHAFHPLELQCRPFSENYGAGTCELVYRYQNATLYRFDTETNKLSTTTDASRLELELGFNPALDFPINEDLVLALLGGTTAGVTIKDLLSSDASKNKRRILAGILGGISGYGLGYKLGTGQTPGPESAEIRTILNNEEQWQKQEKVFYKQLALRGYEAADFIKDEKESEKYKTLSAVYFGLAERTPDLDPIDFMMVADCVNKASQLASRDPKYNVTTDSTFLTWLPWLPLFLGLTVFIVSIIRNKKKTRVAGNGIVPEHVHVPTKEEIERFGS